MSQNKKKPVILIVEDEEDIQVLIELSLQPLCDNKNLNVTIIKSASGEEALRLYKEYIPHIVILDLQLPDLDGLSVCSRIKKSEEYENNETSIVILSARDAQKDIILGYDLGADDYITKPFVPTIFSARIKSLLQKVMRDRNIKSTIPSNNTQVKNKVYKNLVLNQFEKVLYIENTKIYLSAMEWQVLELFVDNPQRLFSRQDIIDNVKGKGYPINARTVDVHIAALRKKLGDNSTILQTIRGMGYKLI